MDHATVTSPESPVIVDRAVASDTAIKKHVMWAMGVGLVPVPLVDIAGVGAVQMAMISDICKIFGVSFSQERTRSIVASLLGAFLPLSVATTASSLLKFVPLLGTTVGVLTMPLAAGASTYAVGKVFVQHFEAGGTILTLDPKAVRDYFATEFEHGKKFVADLKKK
jgi:uncharacterized protein (DUF697 family)